jgi:putative FmdB family regulatory protein
MPLYEYHCPECGKDYDEFRSLENRDAEGKCPGCGGTKPERKISLFASSWGSHFGTVGGGSASSCGSGGFT